MTEIGKGWILRGPLWLEAKDKRESVGKLERAHDHEI